MSFDIQNPDATQALQELYDLVGQLKIKVDSTISPIALIDDGWRRITYIAFAETIAASTAAGDRPLHEPSPDFSFQLLFLQLQATGNLVGQAVIKVDPQGVLPGADVGYQDVTFDGVDDPENHRTFPMIGGSRPSAPPNMNWDVRHPGTGVGETFQIQAIIAQVPRGMRFGT